MTRKPMKMDGTTRKARQPKRTTKELPFWIEVAFSRAYQEGLAVSQGKKSTMLSFDQLTPLHDVAGYNAGRAGLDEKQAFKALQEFAAQHGYHRD